MSWHSLKILSRVEERKNEQSTEFPGIPSDEMTSLIQANQKRGFRVAWNIEEGGEILNFCQQKTNLLDG